MNETSITQSIINYIQTEGGDAWHVHGSAVQRAGEPDIDGWIVYKGKKYHLKVEVKTPTGRPSNIQIFRLLTYSQADYVAGIVTSVDSFRHLLEDYNRNFPLPHNSITDYINGEQARKYVGLGLL